MVSRYISNDRHCLPELEGQFYLGKHINKVEHEGIATCARTEIDQDADNMDQKVKWFLKVMKQTNFCGELIVNFFCQVFYSGSHFTKFSILKMRVKLRN